MKLSIAAILVTVAVAICCILGESRGETDDTNKPEFECLLNYSMIFKEGTKYYSERLKSEAQCIHRCNELYTPVNGESLGGWCGWDGYCHCITRKRE